MSFKKIVAVAAMSFLAPLALAQESASVEVLLGAYSQKAEFDGFSSSTENTIGFGVRGGYQFHRHFAIEAAYLHFGEAEWSYIDDWGDAINEKADLSALSIGIKASYPINGLASIHGRLGLARWDIDYSFADAGYPEDNFSASDDGVDLYFGFGGEYNLTQNLYAGVEYSYMKADAGFMGESFDYIVSGFQGYIGYRF